MGNQRASSNVILIVDDTPSNLQVLFTYLEQASFKVLVAQNGDNALEIASLNHPDLILLDVLMPGMDGFEVCRHLKAQAVTQDIPVIFLTALSETINQVKGFEVGGVDYVTKPIEQEEVLARIQTHLTLQRMRQRLLEQNEELQKEISTRKQVELHLQQALNFEALVRRIREKIRDSLDETQILQTATTQLVQLLQVDGCYMELYNCDQSLATVVYEHSTTLPSCQGMTRKVAEFRHLYQQLLQQNSLQVAQTTPEFSPQRPHSTFLICPIFENHGLEGILGNLWLLRPSEECFSDNEVQLVQQVANQCAIAIRQARLYEAAQAQVKALENLNRLKDDFLKTISHELRAPMSSIQLAAQTLEKFLLAEREIQKTAKFTKVFQIFHQACQRQNQLVDDILSLCYLDAKAETITKEWIDLHILIPEVIQSFLSCTQEQQQELNIDLPENLPPIHTDINTLDRIMRELVHNACKYTPSQEKIIVAADTNDQILELSIINSGVHIPPEEQEKIFTQFYRIPHHDPWQYGGTGLGLTLVKKLVELLGATIEVQSAANKTAFILHFPLTPLTN